MQILKLKKLTTIIKNAFELKESGYYDSAANFYRLAYGVL